MTLLQDRPTSIRLEQELPTVRRERGLAPSLSGRFFVVIEVTWHRVGPGDTEADWRPEPYEVSGWYRGKSRAGRRLAQLRRQGRWLAESSKRAMKERGHLKLAELEWEVGR